MRVALHLDILEANVLVDGENDDFDERNDDHLKWTRLPQQSTVSYQHSRSREISCEQTETEMKK